MTCVHAADMENFLDSCKEFLELKILFCLIKAVSLDLCLLQELGEKMTDFCKQRKKRIVWLKIQGEKGEANTLY